MAEVVDEHGWKLSARDDEKVVETFVADGAHKSFGEDVGPGRRDGHLDGVDADRGEDGVKALGELGAAVADDEPEMMPRRFELGREVASHLGDPGTAGVGQ